MTAETVSPARGTVAPQAGDAGGTAQYIHAVAEVARSVARTTPAPRGMPFFGLDMEVHEPLVLDEFCRQGIFRKYERVLILNCGFGGAARWWATRFGCTVIGTSQEADVAHGADGLSRRAGLRGPTTFVAASESSVPLRPECVTHVWIRDPVDDADVEGRLQQVFRVLRPGGHLTADTPTAAILDALQRAAQRVGFIGIETQPLPAVAAPHALLTALGHLESFAASLAAGARRRGLESTIASVRRAALEPRRRIQLFGQRPS